MQRNKHISKKCKIHNDIFEKSLRRILDLGCLLSLELMVLVRSACCCHKGIWYVFSNGFFKMLVKKFMFGPYVTRVGGGGGGDIFGVCVVVIREFGMCVLTVAFELTKLGSLNHNVCLFCFVTQYRSDSLHNCIGICQ